MKIFFDSSAFCKRYVAETGSAELQAIFQTATEIHLSILALTEVLSAANRLVRNKTISQAEYAKLKQNFALDVAATVVHPIHEEIVAESIRCLESGTTRSLDALQVATAIVLGADKFVTADKEQLKIARARHLVVLEV